MTVEVIILALASTVRPTSLAAVYALLSAEAPRRLMTVYIIAGLVFTTTFGLLVIWAFHGIGVTSSTDHARAVAEVAGGIVALVFAAGVVSGRIGGPKVHEAPAVPGRWDRLLKHKLTLRTAAVAGPATHIPGLFYLVALNIIVENQPKTAEGLLAVLLYNAIWFAIPLGALAVCIVRPEAARDAVGAIQQWTIDHLRVIMLVVSFGVGAALVIRGLIGLR